MQFNLVFNNQELATSGSTHRAASAVLTPATRGELLIVEGKEMTREIPLTQGKVALVDDEDYEWLSQYKWCVSRSNNRKWYAETRINGKLVYMHRMIMNAQPGETVDHRDGNVANNQRYNLRICTIAENLRNRGASQRVGRYSRYKGVTMDKRNGKWMASIKSAEGRQIHLGYFTSELSAALAHDVAAKLYHGEFAWLNFPEEYQ
jgi:hypothetical protein